MATKTESFAVTQRMIDNQFIDLKVMAVAGSTSVTVNGQPRLEGVDYAMQDGGLFPLRVKCTADHNGSLNNKFFLLNQGRVANGTPFFVYYNVNGAGNVVTVSNLVNPNSINYTPNPIEVKLNTNDNALVVAQKTALAIRTLSLGCFNVNSPATLDQNTDSRHHPDSYDSWDGADNNNTTSTLYIYNSSIGLALGSGANTWVTDIKSNLYAQPTCGFDIKIIDKPEKNSRLSIFSYLGMSTMTITGTLTNTSDIVTLDKCAFLIPFTLPIGMSVSGTGIPSSTTILNNSVSTGSISITKTAFTKGIAVTSGDISKVGHSGLVSGDVPTSPIGVNITSLITSNSFVPLDVIPRKTSGAPTTPNNAEGTGTVTFTISGFQLSAAATHTGPVTLTLTQPNALQVGDIVRVTYTIDDQSRNLGNRYLPVLWDSKGYSGHDRNKSWLSLDSCSNKTVNLQYTLGGKLDSKNILVCWTGSFDINKYQPSYAQMLLGTSGIDAQIVTLDANQYTDVGIERDMALGNPPTGVNSATLISYDNGQYGQQTDGALVRAIIQLLDQIGQNKNVFLAGFWPTSYMVANIARFRPDLVKGIIWGESPEWDTFGNTDAQAFIMQSVGTLGFPYSSGDITTTYQDALTLGVQARNIYEGVGPEMSQGDLSLMSSDIRCMLINFNYDNTPYNTTPFLDIALASPNVTPGARRVAFGEAFRGVQSRTNIGAPSLTALHHNTVPHLFFQPSGVYSPIVDTAYQNAIMASPGATLSQVSPNSPFFAFGDTGSIADIAAFITTIANS